VTSRPGRIIPGCGPATTLASFGFFPHARPGMGVLLQEQLRRKRRLCD